MNNLIIWSERQIYIIAALLQEADVASEEGEDELLQSILDDRLLQAKRKRISQNN